MIPEIEFQPFGKIPRLARDITVTEKIDGTSGTVYIDDNNEVFAASRNRWLTAANDNYGFAKWVESNKEELRKLGSGWHRGEWWGQGIQSGYGLKEKRFSLFNTGKWRPQKFGSTPVAGAVPLDATTADGIVGCCHVVPVLYQGIFDTHYIDIVLADLALLGSRAAPGFMSPEGIVIYHVAGNLYFKKTIVGDEKPKGVKSE